MFSGTLPPLTFLASVSILIEITTVSSLSKARNFIFLILVKWKSYAVSVLKQQLKIGSLIVILNEKTHSILFWQ